MFIPLSTLSDSESRALKAQQAQDLEVLQFKAQQAQDLDQLQTQASDLAGGGVVYDDGPAPAAPEPTPEAAPVDAGAPTAPVAPDVAPDAPVAEPEPVSVEPAPSSPMPSFSTPSAPSSSGPIVNHGPTPPPMTAAPAPAAPPEPAAATYTMPSFAPAPSTDAGPVNFGVNNIPSTVQEAPVARPVSQPGQTGQNAGPGQSPGQISRPANQDLTDPHAILSIAQPQIDVSQGRDSVLRAWAPALKTIESGGGPSARNLAAIILAENGAGQAGNLAPDNNNWFSISHVEDREFQNGAGVGGRFANYDSPLSSVADFVDLIKNSPRYQQAWELRNAPTDQFIGALAQAGYIVPEPGFPVETWLANTSSGADTFDKVAGDIGPDQGGSDLPVAAAPAVRSAMRQSSPQVDQAALDDPDKWALCGPVAAVLAAVSHGGDWTVAQAKGIAVKLGLWDAANGMHGLQSEVALLKQAGVDATIGDADESRLAADATNGNTPIVSTDGHYYVLQGYDPASGKFDTGGTGSLFRGGGRWMSLADMQRVSGAIQGAAYIDNPATPHPMSDDPNALAITPSVSDPADQSSAAAVVNPDTQPTTEPPPTEATYTMPEFAAPADQADRLQASQDAQYANENQGVNPDGSLSAEGQAFADQQTARTQGAEDAQLARIKEQNAPIDQEGLAKSGLDESNAPTAMAARVGRRLISSVVSGISAGASGLSALAVEYDMPSADQGAQNAAKWLADQAAAHPEWAEARLHGSNDFMAKGVNLDTLASAAEGIAGGTADVAGSVLAGLIIQGAAMATGAAGGFALGGPEGAVAGLGVGAKVGQYGGIGAMEAGSQFDTGVQAGADRKTAAHTALGVGIVNAAIEFKLGKMTEAVTRPSSELIQKLGGERLAKLGADFEKTMVGMSEQMGPKVLAGLWKFGAGVVEESSEEGVQAFVQNLGERVYNPNADLFKDVASNFFGTIPGMAGHSAIHAGVGAALHAPAAASEAHAAAHAEAAAAATPQGRYQVQATDTTHQVIDSQTGDVVHDNLGPRRYAENIAAMRNAHEAAAPSWSKMPSTQAGMDHHSDEGGAHDNDIAVATASGKGEEIHGTAARFLDATPDQSDQQLNQEMRQASYTAPLANALQKSFSLVKSALGGDTTFGQTEYHGLTNMPGIHGVRVIPEGSDNDGGRMMSNIWVAYAASKAQADAKGIETSSPEFASIMARHLVGNLIHEYAHGASMRHDAAHHAAMEKIDGLIDKAAAVGTVQKAISQLQANGSMLQLDEHTQRWVDHLDGGTTAKASAQVDQQDNVAPKAPARSGRQMAAAAFAKAAKTAAAPKPSGSLASHQKAHDQALDQYDNAQLVIDRERAHKAYESQQAKIAKGGKVAKSALIDPSTLPERPTEKEVETAKADQKTATLTMKDASSGHAAHLAGTEREKVVSGLGPENARALQQNEQVRSVVARDGKRVSDPHGAELNRQLQTDVMARVEADRPTAKVGGKIAAPAGYKPGTPEYQVQRLLDYDARASDDGKAHTSGAELAALPLSPSESDPFKLTSIDDYRALTEAGLPFKDWYEDVADRAAEAVGVENLPEFFTLFGINSSQTPWNETVVGSIRTMRVARELEARGELDYEHLKDRKNVLSYAQASDGKAAQIATMYESGAAESSGPKTPTFSGTFVTSGNRRSQPFTTQDMWQGRVLGLPFYKDNAIALDKNFRFGHAITDYIAREMGVSGPQAQAAQWYAMMQLVQNPLSAPNYEAWQRGEITLGEAIKRGIENGIFSSQGAQDGGAAFDRPTAQKEIDLLQVVLNAPAPGKSALARLEYHGARDAKGNVVAKPAIPHRPSTAETVKAGQNEQHAGAATVNLPSAKLLEQGGYDVGRQIFPWISAPHSVDLLGDTATIHFPSGNRDTGRYYAALFADVLGTDATWHIPDAHAPDNAGLMVQHLSEKAIQNAQEVLRRDKIEHQVVPDGTSKSGSTIRIPDYRSEGNDWVDRVVASLSGVGIIPAQVDAYKGVSGHAEDYAGASQELGDRFSAGRFRGLQERAIDQLRAAVEQGRSGEGSSDRGVAAFETAWKRYYHGSGSPFEHPQSVHFDEGGLFGPGYYLTDDPRVAGGNYDERGRNLSPQNGYAQQRAPIGDMTPSDWRHVEERVGVLLGIQNRSKLRRGEPISLPDRVFEGLQSITDPKDAIPALGNILVDVGMSASQAKSMADNSVKSLQSGQHVRAEEVPGDLNFLDASKTVSTAFERKILALIKKQYGQAKHDLAVEQFDMEVGHAGRKFDTFFRMIQGVLGGPEWAIELIQDLGYDGVKYNGGARIPMQDEKGKPIKHEALAVYPKALSKLRNGTSGQVYGSAAFEKYDPEKSERIVRGMAMAYPTVDPSKPETIAKSAHYWISPDGKVFDVTKDGHGESAEVAWRVGAKGAGLKDADDWSDPVGQGLVRVMGYGRDDLAVTIGPPVTAPQARSLSQMASHANRLFWAIENTDVVGGPGRDGQGWRGPDGLNQNMPRNGGTAAFEKVNVAEQYPPAGDEVDGRVVRKHIPNVSSISATMGDDYEELPGIREVPMEALGPKPDDLHLADDYTKRLAEQIRESGEINPLIVGIDARGPWIIEGGHRITALDILDAKSFPAVVVIDGRAIDDGSAAFEKAGKDPLPAFIKVERAGNEVRVTSPYNRSFPARAKLLGGRWTDNGKFWAFPAAREAAVRTALGDVYGYAPKKSETDTYFDQKNKDRLRKIFFELKAATPGGHDETLDATLTTAPQIRRAMWDRPLNVSRYVLPKGVIRVARSADHPMNIAILNERNGVRHGLDLAVDPESDTPRTIGATVTDTPDVRSALGIPADEVLNQSSVAFEKVVDSNETEGGDTYGDIGSPVDGDRADLPGDVQQTPGRHTVLPGPGAAEGDGPRAGVRGSSVAAAGPEGYPDLVARPATAPDLGERDRALAQLDGDGRHTRHGDIGARDRRLAALDARIQHAIPGLTRRSAETGKAPYYDSAQNAIVGGETGPIAAAHELGHALTESEMRPLSTDWWVAIDDTPGAGSELADWAWAKSEKLTKANQWDDNPENPRNYNWPELQAHLVGFYVDDEEQFTNEHPALARAIQSVALTGSRLHRFLNAQSGTAAFETADEPTNRFRARRANNPYGGYNSWIKRTELQAANSADALARVKARDAKEQRPDPWGDSERHYRRMEAQRELLLKGIEVAKQAEEKAPKNGWRPAISFPADVVPLYDDPTDVFVNGGTFLQSGGSGGRARPISPDDTIIPDTLFHVTTDQPAVEASGYLRASGMGGLGGDQQDNIVSLTIDLDIAGQLESDMKLAARIGAAAKGKYISPERRSDNNGWDYDKPHGWVNPGTEADFYREFELIVNEDGAQYHYTTWKWFILYEKPDVIQDGYPGYSPREWMNQYLMERVREAQVMNPLFMDDGVMSVDPEKIGVIRVPRSALKTGALLTNFDVGKNFLEEVRLYGDVPLRPDAAFQKVMPRGDWNGMGSDALEQQLAPIRASAPYALASDEDIAKARQARRETARRLSGLPGMRGAIMRYVASAKDDLPNAAELDQHLAGTAAFQMVMPGFGGPVQAGLPGIQQNQAIGGNPAPHGATPKAPRKAPARREAGWSDIVNTVRVGGMLSGGAQIATQLIGNVPLAPPIFALHFAQNAVSGASHGGGVMGAVNAEWNWLMGFNQGLIDLWKNKKAIVLDQRRSYQVVGQNGQAPGELDPPKNPAKRALWRLAQALNVPSRVFLEAPDMMFWGGFRMARLRQMAGEVATKKGLTGSAWWNAVNRQLAHIPTDMEAEARSFADIMTFKNNPDPAFGVFLGLHRAPGSTGVLFRFLTPFMRTNANVQARGADFTPGMGLISLLLDAAHETTLKPRGQVSDNIGGMRKSYKGERSGSVPLEMRAAWQTAAWGVALPILGYVMQGLVTGNGPDDDKKKRDMIANGWKPNHFRWGTDYIPLRVLGPLAIPMGLIAAWGEDKMYGNTTGDDDIGKLMAAVKAFARVMASTGYTDNLTDSIALFTGGSQVDSIESWEQSVSFPVASTIASFMPNSGLIRTIATAVDPLNREVAKVKDVGFGETVRQRLQTINPLDRAKLPAAQNAIGDTVSNPRSGLAALVNIGSKAKDDPFLNAMTKAGVGVAARPTKMADPFNPGKPFKLAPDEARAWQQTYGANLRRLWDARDNPTDARRLDIIEQQANEAADAALYRMMVAKDGRSALNIRGTKDNP